MGRLVSATAAAVRRVTVDMPGRADTEAAVRCQKARQHRAMRGKMGGRRERGEDVVVQ